MSNDKIEALKKFCTLTLVGSRRFNLEHEKSDYDYIAFLNEDISTVDFLNMVKKDLKVTRFNQDIYIKGGLLQIKFAKKGIDYSVTILDKEWYYKQAINNNIVEEYLKNISEIKFKLIKDLKHKYLGDMTGTIFFYTLLKCILDYNTEAIINYHTKDYSSLFDYGDQLDAVPAVRELEAIIKLDF
jgi:hypothetical protein